MKILQKYFLESQLIDVMEHFADDYERAKEYEKALNWLDRIIELQVKKHGDDTFYRYKKLEIIEKMENDSR